VKLVTAIIGFLAMVLGCFVFGFAWPDIQKGQLPSTSAISNLFGVKSGAAATPELEFTHAYSKVLAEYIKPVDSTTLKYAGMEGLMSSLGDPHTMFMPPKASEAFNDETKANFGGIGARLGQDPLGARLSDVFDGGPAKENGLKGGDIITAVDGKQVGGMDIDDVVTMIKGKEGTIVKLTWMEPGKHEPITKAIKRARIIAPTVESKYFPDYKVGYISVASFSEPTADQFGTEIDKLEQHPLKGLVIDLRENPGGLLQSACDMLGYFVEDKLVVRMKFRDGKEEIAKSPSGFLHNFNYPILVLINEDSASAAEIFSGCLRDFGKAKLVGEHSYGKSSVQNVFPLVDQSSAKITIAKYYLPLTPYYGRKLDQDGGFISGGLEPDVKVDLDPNATIDPDNPKTDAQLWRAIEMLNPQAATTATTASAGH